LVIISD